MGEEFYWSPLPVFLLECNRDFRALRRIKPRIQFHDFLILQQSTAMYRGNTHK